MDKKDCEIEWTNWDAGSYLTKQKAREDNLYYNKQYYYIYTNHSWYRNVNYNNDFNAL